MRPSKKQIPISSNLAHPWPLCQVMEAIAWLPAEFGPNRENHVVRSGSVVNEVAYEKGRISYSTYDAPVETQEVLRLAFAPTSVQADGRSSNNGKTWTQTAIR
jgi:hypothetical protein